MYATIRHYRMGAGSMDDAMHLVDTDLADRFAEEPGFVAYECMQVGENEIVSVTTFQDMDSCEQSNEIAAEFVREELSDYQLERTSVWEGEVMVSRARQEVLEPTHH